MECFHLIEAINRCSRDRESSKEVQSLIAYCDAERRSAPENFTESPEGRESVPFGNLLDFLAIDENYKKLLILTFGKILTSGYGGPAMAKNQTKLWKEYLDFMYPDSGDLKKAEAIVDGVKHERDNGQAHLNATAIGPEKINDAMTGFKTIRPFTKVNYGDFSQMVYHLFDNHDNFVDELRAKYEKK